MKIIACPCCGYNRYLTLKKFQVSDLSALWIKHFSLEPFGDLSKAESFSQLQCMQCSLIFHSPEFLGKDEFYANLSRYDWYYESDKWEFDVAIELIQKFRPESLLEVGCGSGEFLQKVATGIESLVGVDINLLALSRAREKGLNVTNHQLSQLNQSFDMIVLFEVLEHLEAPGKMLKDIFDSLNPGGIAIIAVPNPQGYLKDQGVVLLDLPPHHNTKWRRETFSYIASHFGLEEILYVVEPIRYIHYQAYMAAIISSGAKRSYIKFLQRVAFKILGPFLYDIKRDQIQGQTHLVAFKKPAKI